LSKIDNVTSIIETKDVVISFTFQKLGMERNKVYISLCIIIKNIRILSGIGHPHGAADDNQSSGF
jgi:hypothetical protein